MSFLEKPTLTKFYRVGGNTVAGAYMCRCITCDTVFCGDKRDSVCPVCEYEALTQRIKAQEEQIAQLEIRCGLRDALLTVASEKITAIKSLVEELERRYASRA